MTDLISRLSNQLCENLASNGVSVHKEAALMINVKFSDFFESFNTVHYKLAFEFYTSVSGELH